MALPACSLLVAFGLDVLVVLLLLRRVQLLQLLDLRFGDLFSGRVVRWHSLQELELSKWSQERCLTKAKKWIGGCVNICRTSQGDPEYLGAGVG